MLKASSEEGSNTYDGISPCSLTSRISHHRMSSRLEYKIANAQLKLAQDLDVEVLADADAVRENVTTETDYWEKRISR